MLSYSIIALSAFFGLLISCKILWDKHVKKKKMTCPLNMECDAVVNSSYSRFFGVPVEWFGIGYYALVAAVFASSFLFSGVIDPIAQFTILMITTIGFLFSLYLTIIQIFTIKEYCSWCLGAALMNLIIFIVSWTSMPLDFAFLVEYHRVSVGIHLVGMALGLGGATISDIMFFRFLKDLKISAQESEVLESLSQIIWFGLGLGILSGIALYLEDPAGYIASAKFMVKMIVVGVIVINGTFLNLVVSPKLIRISFGQKHKHHPGELHQLRKIAFALGGVSIISWYSAFVLGMFRTSPASFSVLLAIYMSLLTLGIIGGQVLESIFSRKKS